MRLIFVINLVSALMLQSCASIKSNYASDEIINDYGVWGRFVEPKETSKNPVLFVGGSEGGLPQYYSYYADTGHPVLALGYFNPRSTGLVSPSFIPTEFNKIPLESFANGLKWLKQKYPDRKIIVVAGSKGAEAVLAYSSTGDEDVKLIDKLILITASSYAFEGVLNMHSRRVKNSGSSAWTYRGREIPYVHYPKGRAKVIKGKVLLRDHYEEAIAAADKQGTLNEAMFTLKHLLNAKILFISGERDLMWNTTGMINKLLEANKENNAKKLFLKDAGHMVYNEHRDDQASYFPYLMGDTSEEAVKAAKKATSDFLAE